MVSYLQVDVDCAVELTEILIAELSEMGYDSFWEKEDGGFTAYIDENIFNESELKFLIENYKHNNVLEINFLVSKLEKKNWNEEWERNFEPIVISDKCYVRATFHQARVDIPIEVIIDPKMSFGTGHHATTSMMIEHLLNHDLNQKSLMDVGCGTGILSIAAAKMGAVNIIGFDIEDWTVENANENKILNNTSEIEFLESTIADLAKIGEKYDYVLANITRNVLLEEIKMYVTYLSESGKLFVSGFYLEDEPSITEEANKYGLVFESKLVQNNWCSVVYTQKKAN